MKLVGNWWRVKNLILSSVSGSAGDLQVRKSKRKTQATKQNRLKPYDNASVLLPLRKDWWHIRKCFFFFSEDAKNMVTLWIPMRTTQIIDKWVPLAMNEIRETVPPLGNLTCVYFNVQIGPKRSGQKIFLSNILIFLFFNIYYILNISSLNPNPLYSSSKFLAHSEYNQSVLEGWKYEEWLWRERKREGNVFPNYPHESHMSIQLIHMNPIYFFLNIKF